MGEKAKPQDHKPKAAKAAKPVVERTEDGFEVTHRGVRVTIPTAALDDFEMLRDLGKLQDAAVGNNAKLALVPAIFTRFFGEAQSGVVLDALRDPETKRVRVEVASTFLFEVFRGLNPES